MPLVECPDCQPMASLGVPSQPEPRFQGGDPLFDLPHLQRPQGDPDQVPERAAPPAGILLLEGGPDHTLQELLGRLNASQRHCAATSRAAARSAGLTI
jgi:hypothetical protein